MKINVNNKGKSIGRVNANEYNLKKLCLITGISAAVVIAVPVGFHIASKNKVVDPAPTIALSSDYDAPIHSHIISPLDGTYKVKYKVEYGDTLYGLVTSYCEDGEYVNYILDEIVRDKDNDLDNASQIRQGKEYTLYGVPYDHLADFGYFVPNRDELTNEEKINDDIDFIKSYSFGRDSYKMNLDVIKYGQANIEFIEEVKDELRGLLQMYRDYSEMEDSPEKEKAETELLLMLDGAKTDIKLITGDEFHQPAYKSETLNKTY